MLNNLLPGNLGLVFSDTEEQSMLDDMIGNGNIPFIRISDKQNEVFQHCQNSIENSGIEELQEKELIAVYLTYYSTEIYEA